MEFGHYASQSNISAYMRLILIRRSLRSQFPRALTAAPVQRRAGTAVSMREAVRGRRLA